MAHKSVMANRRKRKKPKPSTPEFGERSKRRVKTAVLGAKKRNIPARRDALVFGSPIPLKTRKRIAASRDADTKRRLSTTLDRVTQEFELRDDAGAIRPKRKKKKK